MMEQPKIKVGILTSPQVRFNLIGDFTLDGSTASGFFEANLVDGMIEVAGKKAATFTFVPAADDALIELLGVTIGVNFHWERRETQRFRGQLKLIIENGGITAINILPVEDYLCSVISSEMSATASLELLKAHAVISRSWLLAQIDKSKTITDNGNTYSAMVETEQELIKWYDREDHRNFDVCADDHCQRYQGVTRQTTPTVAQAIAATSGEVLMADGKLCDARFSKCCGGVFERFENCWEPVPHSYLQERRDGVNPTDFPDLTIEENAREWILSKPEAFCDTSSAEILGQVLNNYDQETTDFYRWTVEYGQDELSELIARRSGVDYGKVIDLVPVGRGQSARLTKLKIVGTKRQRVIGKELEIRRTLSPSHLYSSAFVVERLDVDADGIPARFVIHGAGWGHGVGLCQIGAAVMGAKGYDYKSILSHYFIGAECRRLY
jgi:SpoIID/LytB domain protein